jgi:hypothetical protein
MSHLAWSRGSSSRGSHTRASRATWDRQKRVQAQEGTGDFRVIDESGDDYLFSADRFITIDVPARVKAVLWVSTPPTRRSWALIALEAVR